MARDRMQVLVDGKISVLIAPDGGTVWTGDRGHSLFGAIEGKFETHRSLSPGRNFYRPNLRANAF